jgi:hypothetical protein
MQLLGMFLAAGDSVAALACVAGFIHVFASCNFELIPPFFELTSGWRMNNSSPLARSVPDSTNGRSFFNAAHSIRAARSLRSTELNGRSYELLTANH